MGRVVRQGEVWWAEMPASSGSEPGFRRPVVVVQGNRINRSAISTVVCVALTTNLRLGSAPGNLVLAPADSGLKKDSVANVSQVATLDKADLTERAGSLPKEKLELILTGIDIILGR